MGDFGFCRKCGKIKENKQLPFCLSCYELYRADLTNIKAYLKKNPGATAMDIARATEIEIDRIFYFIKTGAIIIKK